MDSDMSPYHSAGDIQVYHGDCQKVLSQLREKATAVVTDPPYGLAFMGREWDDFEPLEYQKWCKEWAEVVKSSMRPGAPLLAFSGTRTFHRAICGVEDAGFSIRDCISWTYAEGFPKSHDISKAIDDAKGAERGVTGYSKSGARNESTWDQDSGGVFSPNDGHERRENPATDEAETWNGYGTALAPSWEPICYATKPREGTYAENALEHGVAGLNIDGGRLEYNGEVNRTEREADGDEHHQGGTWEERGRSTNRPSTPTEKGRWPANVIFNEEAARGLDAEVGVLHSGGSDSSWADSPPANSLQGSKDGSLNTHKQGPDRERSSGGPSRYFYTSKASKGDRNAGMPPGETNDWPTVKPTDLIGWLLRLVEMPKRNLILDPFCGSGTTAYVCQQMGLPCIAIDQSERACELTANRLSEPSLFS